MISIDTLKLTYVADSVDKFENKNLIDFSSIMNTGLGKVILRAKLYMYV